LADVKPGRTTMNSTAVSGTAYVNTTRKTARSIRSAVIAAAVAVPLAGCLEATLAPQLALAPEVAPAVARGPCPSQDFPAFLDAFGESVDVQRGYTHIPLVYGTPKEDKAFTTRTINSFDSIPVYSSKDGGRILRSKAKRREAGLKLTVQPGGDDKTKVATVVLPGTKFHLEFHFENTDSCWELVRIDDRSA
jgi:hypothetical protein